MRLLRYNRKCKRDAGKGSEKHNKILKTTSGNTEISTTYICNVIKTSFYWPLSVSVVVDGVVVVVLVVVVVYACVRVFARVRMRPSVCFTDFAVTRLFFSFTDASTHITLFSPHEFFIYLLPP